MQTEKNQQSLKPNIPPYVVTDVKCLRDGNKTSEISLLYSVMWGAVSSRSANIWHVSESLEYQQTLVILTDPIFIPVSFWFFFICFKLWIATTTKKMLLLSGNVHSCSLGKKLSWWSWLHGSSSCSALWVLQWCIAGRRTWRGRERETAQCSGHYQESGLPSHWWWLSVSVAEYREEKNMFPSYCPETFFSSTRAAAGGQ